MTIAKEMGAMVSAAFPLKQHPNWMRGLAHIEGNTIVLDEESAKEYPILHSEHRPDLLVDFTNLLECKPQAVMRFVKRHGLLWHGPKDLGSGKCRELLSDWQDEVVHLRLTIYLWLSLKLAEERGTAKPARDLLRRLRGPDIDAFYAPIPDDDQHCLETVSVVLAERITGGMEGSSWTLVADCTLAREGVQEGTATDFSFGESPPNLVAAAYVQLASFIASKIPFAVCEGCGRLFKPTHGSQRHCGKTCADRARQVRRRTKRGRDA